ncbi:MAG: hypothetical protein R2794_03700 [Chitinophagales bacterium]
MKRKKILPAVICLYISAAASAENNAPDTSFKRSDPSLLYTTREYFIDISDDCYGNVVCIQDMFMLVRFNVGIDRSQTIHQIGFKNVDLSFEAKAPMATSYTKYATTKCTSKSTQNGWNVFLEMYPGQAGSLVQKCTFDAKVEQHHISGILTFYMQDGTTSVIRIQ